MAKKAKPKTRATKKKAASAKTTIRDRVAAKAATKTPGRVERKRYVEKHPVKIADDVVAKKADEFAAAYREREACLESRRNDMAEHRETLTGIDERMKALSVSIEKHTEMRDVTIVEYLLPTNEIECVRADTGEVVKTRVADADDLQDDLFAADSKKKIEQRDAGNAKEAKRSRELFDDVGEAPKVTRRRQAKPGEEITSPASLLANDAGVDAEKPNGRSKKKSLADEVNATVAKAFDVT